MDGQRRTEKRPGWNPKANPVKLKCAGKHVYGWVYADGTIELVCQEKHCRRPGQETRHLFNPVSGEEFPIWIPKPQDG